MSRQITDSRRVAAAGLAAAAFCAALFWVALVPGTNATGSQRGEPMPRVEMLILRTESSLRQGRPPSHWSTPSKAAQSRDSMQPVRLRLDTMLSSIVGSAVAAETPPVPAESISTSSPARLRPGAVRLDLLARVRDLGNPADADEAFGAKSWLVPPPPPPPPPPPGPVIPRAPPLPFRFLGQIDDGAGKVIYFLARGVSSISVSAGETLDNLYLFEGAEGGALKFTFLPLKERQSLTIGVAQ